MSLRTIVLLRHGEAEHMSLRGGDHGRHLTDRGREQIARTSKQLLERGFKASVVYSSDAQRTLETSECLPQEIYAGGSLKYEPALYQAAENKLFNYLFQTDDTATSILIVGHNPGLSDMASHLAAPHRHLATGDAILFEAELDSWSRCDVPGTWKMIQHIHPGKN